MTDPVCVVHLVRAGNPSEMLRSFLESYRGHDAGIDHELVLLLKGFSGAAAAEEQVALSRGLDVHTVRVSDQGFDLTAYTTAARRLARPRYCFLNSHSRVLGDGWLAALAAAHDDGAGIVGASGSWASMLSYSLYIARLPSAYRRTLGPRSETVAELRALAEERAGTRAPRGWRRQIGSLQAMMDMSLGFSRFPAPHVRTTAFLIGHETLERLDIGITRRKADAHRLESGRRSITRRIEALGKPAVVVDRSGQYYEWRDWPQSETFWRAEQAGLLVADNQTDDYLRGSARRRWVLSHYAWGECAG